MLITYRTGAWVAASTYAEKDAVKTAGFRWHGVERDTNRCRPGCPACAAGVPLKVWWTSDAAKATRLAAYCDPTATAALAGHTASVAASRAAAPTAATAATCAAIPAPTGLIYLPFQAAGIAYALARPNTLIADEMGLGKTIQALGVINADATIKQVLVVCPASLRLNWAREAGRWLVRSFKPHVVESNDPIPADAALVIVNYDRLLRQDTFDALMARQWDLLIADEAHYAKNPAARRTRALLGKPARTGRNPEPATPGLADRATRKLLLTGTPLMNKPIELHPLLACLAPAEFGNFMGYAKRYAAAYQGRYGWDFSGSAHLDELQERMRGCCMVRRLKADVLKDLPAKRRQVIELPPNGTARALAHEQAAGAQHEATLAALRDEADLAHAAGDKAAYAAAVAQLTQAARTAFTEMSAARHELAMAKAPHVVAHVTSALEDGLAKGVVFAHHKDVVAALVAGLTGYGVVSITGDTAMDARQAAVDSFQADPAVRVFVGNIQAAGVGLTLTAASTVIFAELDWVPANVTQAEDRCHRIGQHDSVLVQHLVVDGSLDARMAKALVAKQALADKALDDTADQIVVPAQDAAQRPPRPSKYPASTPAQRDAALACLRALARVCDGAVADDGCGYNGCDTGIGHRLAALDTLTDGQAWLARRILPKYRGQLARYGREADLNTALNKAA